MRLVGEVLIDCVFQLSNGVFIGRMDVSACVAAATSVDAGAVDPALTLVASVRDTGDGQLIERRLSIVQRPGDVRVRTLKPGYSSNGGALLFSVRFSTNLKKNF
jgi:hypothetical protein